ncbi:Hypothetical protein MexAM1_META1p4029 [Methylorubrum extorquens AM1]|uniref:Uncharacterized protein n=1 Tax=Methylorubrum extorquens (strain ATCC 14718 / DSM 1338 / JCM 2805 / NCIMB 9133 / AM1) TaxID=272630 RepID=C5B1A2_METEA|nr:Hypothetical protein MexAM1_META1p4029 [Methylorubrum extorquens AM1]
MKQVKPGSCTFQPAAGILDFSALSGFDVVRLFAVINLRTRRLLYAVGRSGLGFSQVAGAVVTLEVETSDIGAGDPLPVLYDDGDTASDTKLEELRVLLDRGYQGVTGRRQHGVGKHRPKVLSARYVCQAGRGQDRASVDRERAGPNRHGRHTPADPDDAEGAAGRGDLDRRHGHPLHPRRHRRHHRLDRCSRQCVVTSRHRGSPRQRQQHRRLPSDLQGDRGRDGVRDRRRARPARGHGRRCGRSRLELLDQRHGRHEDRGALGRLDRAPVAAAGGGGHGRAPRHGQYGPVRHRHRPRRTSCHGHDQ